MKRRYPAALFTESVRRVQEENGARESARHLEQMPFDDAELSARETVFIQEREGFYLGTVGEDGWPYVQYRGGPRGFVHALDEQTLAYADFGGNRQFISMGNLRAEPRCSLFFMDYANRRRLKVLARASYAVAADEPELAARLSTDGYAGRVERIVRLRVEAFDWNCPAHITPRFTEAEWAARS